MMFDFCKCLPVCLIVALLGRVRSENGTIFNSWQTIEFTEEASPALSYPVLSLLNVSVQRFFARGERHRELLVVRRGLTESSRNTFFFDPVAQSWLTLKVESETPAVIPYQSETAFPSLPGSPIVFIGGVRSDVQHNVATGNKQVLRFPCLSMETRRS